MKLIDVDNLKPTKGMFIYQTEDADVIATEAYRWELIEREAPTVEAIPIEWIKKWYKNALSESGFMGDEIISIADMLEQWEKENANNN